MKKYLLIFLSITAIYGCRNANQKEIGKVEALVKILDDTEQNLHAIDTNKLFSITKLVREDIQRIKSNGDTLNKEAAFKVEDYFGRTKTLYHLNDNYLKYDKEILYLKNQLANLEQDLSNNLIKKDDFDNYYRAEQKSIMMISNEVNLVTKGFKERIEKMIVNRDDFLKLLEDPNSYMNKK